MSMHRYRDAPVTRRTYRLGHRGKPWGGTVAAGQGRRAFVSQQWISEMATLARPLIVDRLG